MYDYLHLLMALVLHTSVSEKPLSSPLVPINPPAPIGLEFPYSGSTIQHMCMHSCDHNLLKGEPFSLNHHSTPQELTSDSANVSPTSVVSGGSRGAKIPPFLF